MDPLTAAAASGIRSRLESLEMLANNLANAATPGYKSDREFYGLFAPEAGEGPDLESGEAAVMPMIERPWIDFSQGTLQPTGNSLDLAISGQGFFAVSGTKGALYTRNGAFHLSPSGVLTSAGGLPVRSVGGSSIQLDPSKPIDVSPEGFVRQNGAVAGQIEVLVFADLSSLVKSGGGYFEAPSGIAGRPPAAGDAEVHQGKLEGSNIAVPEAAVRLVGVMRQFEMLQRAITLGGEMNKRSIEEVARVGS